MENQGDLANLILMGSVAITTIIASIKYNKKIYIEPVVPQIL